MYVPHDGNMLVVQAAPTIMSGVLCTIERKLRLQCKSILLVRVLARLLTNLVHLAARVRCRVARQAPLQGSKGLVQ